MNLGIDSEMDVDCRVVVGVGGCMEFCSDGMCLELCFRNIPEMVSKDCVPLQLLLFAYLSYEGLVGGLDMYRQKVVPF